jgi:thioredoxin 1
MAAVFTDSNFESDVLKADKLSVVDFWAPWCGPCLAIGPVIEALATEYSGKVNIGKINVDENPKVSVDYGVTSIPCILFIKDGKVVDKQIGAAPKAAFDKKIQKLLGL